MTEQAGAPDSHPRPHCRNRGGTGFEACDPEPLRRFDLERMRTGFGQSGGIETMPRLGVTIHDSFGRRQQASKPDSYGRRVRQVRGVEVAAESGTPMFSPLFLKLTMTLSLVAIAAASLAAWRLFTFPH
jgi:hypothetical protein